KVLVPPARLPVKALRHVKAIRVRCVLSHVDDWWTVEQRLFLKDLLEDRCADGPVVDEPYAVVNRVAWRDCEFELGAHEVDASDEPTRRLFLPQHEAVARSPSEAPVVECHELAE